MIRRVLNWIWDIGPVRCIVLFPEGSRWAAGNTRKLGLFARGLERGRLVRVVDLRNKEGRT